MKILFICGSAEPGKDGVGDYTRRICGELCRWGQNVQIVSLYDHDVISFTPENQMIELTLVMTQRIPSSITNKQRFAHLQTIINNFEPEWISLQFVPYSFNPKGLPFWLPSFLRRLKGNHQWHIMFHELWLAIDIESSFKHKCIGEIQKLIVKKIISKIKPNYITTQNQLYQLYLESYNINAEVLPLCGNIPVTAIKKEDSKYIHFVLFGTIHPNAPFSDFVSDLMRISNRFTKPIKFVFIGENSSELPLYKTILVQNNTCFEVLGIQSEKVISQVLLDSDYGICTTPYFQIEKSGVYAAYREHQLITICVARKWTPLKCPSGEPKIIKYEKNDLKLIPIYNDAFDLHSMTMQFINSISKL